MSKRTGVIRYNLNDTGRDFTGTRRHVDVDAAMRLFNGVVTQEMVRKGDIVGYVGHQYRLLKTGLDVPETVIVDGKEVVLEPAMRTVYLKCYPNGDVEHEQEFLDTASGRVAQRLWESKAYGFSSAIHAPTDEATGLRVPMGYFGMDLVRGPNYDTNRGYTVMLDSVGAADQGGQALSDHAAMLDAVDRMIKESDAHAAEISVAYLAQCKLNDELIDNIARLRERLQAAGQQAPMLDNAPNVMERGIAMDTGAAMLDSAARFMAIPEKDLPTFEEPSKEPEPGKDEGAVAKGVKSALSVVGSVLGWK